MPLRSSRRSAAAVRWRLTRILSRCFLSRGPRSIPTWRPRAAEAVATRACWPPAFAPRRRQLASTRRAARRATARWGAARPAVACLQGSSSSERKRVARQSSSRPCVSTTSSRRLNTRSCTSGTSASTWLPRARRPSRSGAMRPRTSRCSRGSMAARLRPLPRRIDGGSGERTRASAARRRRAICCFLKSRRSLRQG